MCGSYPTEESLAEAASRWKDAQFKDLNERVDELERQLKRRDPQCVPAGGRAIGKAKAQD